MIFNNKFKYKNESGDCPECRIAFFAIFYEFSMSVRYTIQFRQILNGYCPNYEDQVAFLTILYIFEHNGMKPYTMLNNSICFN